MSPAECEEALRDASIRRDPPPARAKAVLFCPTCGHESHAAGDWDARDDYVAGTRAVVCPECATRVTERPLPKESANVDGDDGWSRRRGRGPWETWRDLWRSSVELLARLPKKARA